MINGKTELAPGIWAYDNVLVNSDSVIEEIEYAVSLGVLDWHQAGVYENNASTHNKKTRDTDSIGIPYLDFKDFDSPKGYARHELRNLFFSEFDPCIQDYLANSDIIINDYHNYEILRYGVGQKFDAHVDDSPAYPRKLSLVYYANDAYEGGEIEFKNFNLKFKPNKHQLILFPSHDLYNHKVHTVTSGTRYAVVQWMN